jgi:hypothetical protein
VTREPNENQDACSCNHDSSDQDVHFGLPFHMPKTTTRTTRVPASYSPWKEGTVRFSTVFLEKSAFGEFAQIGFTP